ncbi:hypothetical protein ACJX0J_024381, partial [Zea mays]
YLRKFRTGCKSSGIWFHFYCIVVNVIAATTVNVIAATTVNLLKQKQKGNPWRQHFYSFCL